MSPSRTAQNQAGQDSVAVLDDAAQVAAILSPLRRRILGHLHQEPDSASGLSRKLELPRQKLNYHLRELERAGFLELAEEKQRRGCVERALRPTARAYLINPALLGELAADPETIRDRFSSNYLIAVAGRVVRDVSDMRRGAARARKRLPTFTLQTDIRFKSPEDRAAFAEELSGTVARLAAKYHDDSPGSRAYRFVIGGHPAVTGKRKSAAERRRKRKREASGKASGASEGNRERPATKARRKNHKRED
jgi:DNA-binding transcriptional ArsR family regulator